MRIKLTLLLALLTASTSLLFAQVTLRGEILDGSNGDPLIGASVLVKGTTTGTVTEIDGSFSLQVDGLPVILQISYIGFESIEKQVLTTDENLSIKLGDNAITTDVIEVKGRRISEKQRQSALTVETLDAIAIKETPAANFYDGLGSLKDVDLTSASLGFKIINTRGFNSTNPVRSLQIIDGVDNQSPGLNFSLGNFLGASDLDVNRVNLVVGASSAFYGPNAFNGVISMETKDPFLQQGLSAEIKAGSRNLYNAGFRWAQALKNKDGQDWFAYKVNFYGFQADDWVADNTDPVDGTLLGRDNLGGYDAVNVYGDEENRRFNFPYSRSTLGLGSVRRQGYAEEDLVDYDSENIKVGLALHFRLNPAKTLESTELLVASNYSTGTTVYQGDNRFSLKDIQFFQHRLELRNRDNFFIRAYVTHEDAGNSYDPYFTAIELLNLSKSDNEWRTDYRNFWSTRVNPIIRGLEGYPDESCFPFSCTAAELNNSIRDFVATPAVQELLPGFNQQAREFAQQENDFGQNAYYEVGTQRFQEAFDSITSALVTDGGTRFFDRSALYHLHGEKKLNEVWKPNEDSRLDLTVGGNYRLYTPNSKGTILLDTNGRDIDTYEFGLYGGGTLNLNNRYRISASLRADKNQNFDLLFSPAASFVYTPGENTTLRTSFSSAIRNPTLNDQYLFYNVGRAILLGNIDGVQDLATVESVINLANGEGELELFDVPAIQPEKVRTFEVGARTTLFDKVYLDATYYYSFYEDFIGFNIGVDVNELNGIISSAQAYRVAANARDRVTTQGFSIGGNFYFAKYFAFNGNYSWNVLNTATDDPIVPAFNTPEHKYNLGVSGRNVPLTFLGNSIKEFGFSVAYKWIDGFIFEGSPQFTGFIDSYGLLDAQVNTEIKSINTTLKIGASNVLDNQVYQVYGGPRVGRLAYISLTYNWTKK